ncbi:PucR family transcriptional regulator ligand-binding domain-containing protein [Streptomyces sp. PTY087I2]|uniref:helix-turn-helix domain-containing protein n=1 Tax=Streptomyces sp. PTY087I2 TaxID=1819298 RepID=UPI00080B0310|nr:PucR family transcriptional regulator ligand-binding domain-containing protein [Streptomyces sp. PTY087I2]OCC09154.1 carbohydrate diacid transcriptional activator CdaR [Streptomyces sp. PTY087I2]
MHVEDLLRLESLDLTLLWGDRPQLTREISGVTATDLEDPGRFLQRGELVLSGLVWWAPADDEAKAERFVAALGEAGAAALLAGEETHGGVPDVLVEACRRHGIAILSVPVHTSFRAVTDTVYLRQWGDLSRRPAAPYALPENVRAELSRLLADGTDPDTLLTRAVAHLGTPPAYVLSATGRTIARTPTAAPLPVSRAAEALTATTTLSVDPDASPYGQWHLHLPEPVGTPPRMLHEIAEVLAQHRRTARRRETTARALASDLLALIDTPSSPAAPAALRRALEACGLADQDPYTVITVKGEADDDGTLDALTEALHHLTDRGFAVGRLPTGEPGEATAVIGTSAESGEDPIATALKSLWPTLQSRNGSVPFHGGMSTPAATPQLLKGALTQARYALTAARSEKAQGTAASTSRLTAIDELTTLDALLTGIPSDVRTAFGIHALGALADATNPSHRMLLETLDVFLTHNGSWARTAEALHLHVNTVHYRIQRVEMLTGRDLARLDHKLDLKAALLCR